MKTKQGIVAFAFGKPASIRSNRILAKIVSDEALEKGIPVYTQIDIKIEKNIDVEYIQQNNNRPPSTLRIAQGAAQWAIRKNLSEIIVVAAPPHLWRCLRDLSYATRARYRFHICEQIYNYPDTVWFCPDSEQKWTRSQRDWEKRDKILYRIPFFVYKLIS